MVLPQLFSRNKSKKRSDKPAAASSSPPPPAPPPPPPPLRESPLDSYTSPSSSSSSTPRHSFSSKNPPLSTPPPTNHPLPRKSSSRPSHSRTSSTPPPKPSSASRHPPSTSARFSFSSASRSSRSSAGHRYSHDPNSHPLNLPPDELRRLTAMAAAADRSSMDIDSNDPRLNSSSSATNGVNGSQNERSPTPPPHTSSGTPAEADSFKLAGNKFFKDGNFARAIEEFNKGACFLVPSPGVAGFKCPSPVLTDRQPWKLTLTPPSTCPTGRPPTCPLITT